MAHLSKANLREAMALKANFYGADLSKAELTLAAKIRAYPTYALQVNRRPRRLQRMPRDYGSDNLETLTE